MEDEMGGACCTYDSKKKIQGFEWGHLKDLCVVRRIILKFIFNK